MRPDIEGWPWLPERCPPDQYFIEYMKKQGNSHSLILHVGTGLHHKVGIECCAMGHYVIGLTVSREEVVSRIFRVETENYQVMYGNINNFDFRLLPQLDIITLFHFGEMESDFGPVDDELLMHLLRRKTADDAFMVFYNRSSAWDRAKVAVEHMVELGRLTHVETFEELEVYRK